MSDSWERQIKEPAMWFARFEQYRAMGPERSVLATINAWRTMRGKNRQNWTPRSWHNNSHTWEWKERAEAWDAAQRQKRLIIEDEERDAMYRRHAQLGLALQTIGHDKLVDLKGKPDEIGANEARLSVKDGVDIERTARGLPKEFVEIIGMSDDDLLAWYREQYSAHETGGSGIEPTGADDPGDSTS